MTQDRTLTPRGFIIYDRFVDLNGAEVRVQESSLATDDATWVFVNGGLDDNKGGIHLNREGVVRLRDALQAALEDEDEYEDDKDEETI